MQIEMWPIDRLTPYARNPRRNEHAVPKMASLIKEFGFKVPVVARSDGSVVDGHLRLMAARHLGMETVPVVLADEWTDAQVKAFRIAVNKSAELAEWDTSLLALEIEDLKELDFDLELTGFELPELEDILGAEADGGTEGQTDPDAVPEAQEAAVSREGDVWLLGRHRLMCGDSTDAGSVALLMAGEKADMVFTDPPYNIESGGGGEGCLSESLNKQKDAIDFISHFDPTDFLKVLPEVFQKNHVNAYVFCNNSLLPQYLNFAVERDFAFNVLVWKKPSAMPINAAHWPDMEYLVFFRKNAIWNYGLDGVSYSRCLEFGREKGLHPTMKPVGLICNELLISSNKGSTVLDLFGGSGSTLIACEKTGRVCRMMELSPRYCDVIVRRWQEFTGQEATLEEDGRTFAQVKEERGA